MDSNNQNQSNDEMWDWECTESYLENDIDMPNCLWDSLNPSEDIPLPFEDEFTPVKACGDFADYVNICDDTSEELEKCVEHSSQGKRRRLHFPPELSDAPPSNEELATRQLRLKDSAEEGFSKPSQKVSGYSECTSSSSSETLDQSSDAWLSNCLNDADTHQVPSNKASDVYIDLTEICKSQSSPMNVTLKQDRPVRIRGSVFKGRRSYIQAPSKLASSIVQPFTFIKPCSLHGDMTLKDINQRIRTPRRLKQIQEDPSYPTSAFSGKPVVGKTTLSTDGGKGSITIMRTKG